MGRAVGSGPRNRLGAAGEDAALGVYRSLGFHLETRNWRCPAGEIDLVVSREGLLVFCEVKTRAGPVFGAGVEAVDGRKRGRLRSLAAAFLAERGEAYRGYGVRFDVASVAKRPGRAPEVELFADAF